MLSILTYHSLDDSGSVVSVSPQGFTRQMAVIAAENYRGITLSEAISHRRLSGEWPDKCVVITFDDGFRNFYDEALPVLKELKFRATIFVVSDFMGKRNDWEVPPTGLGSKELLSWAQLEETSNLGFEVGSHTRTHTDLRRLSREQVRSEIRWSQIEIENRLGKPVKSFAYPFGEVTQASVECLEETFESACTTVLQRANGDSFFKLPRIDMFYIRTDRALRRLLSGELDRYLKFRALGRNMRRRFVA